MVWNKVQGTRVLEQKAEAGSARLSEAERVKRQNADATKNLETMDLRQRLEEQRVVIDFTKVR